MQPLLHPYTVYLFLSSLLTLIASFIAWQRKAPGSVTLSLLMVAMSVWSGAYSLQWVPLHEQIKLLAPYMTYLGVLAVPFLFLVYALQFSNHENWLSPRLFI